MIFACSLYLMVTSAGRTSVDIGASAKLELVDKFCYLGDMHQHLHPQMEMLMQLWRPEFELVGISSGSWYHTHPFTHIHPFNGPLSRTTRVSRYQKGKTNLDFTEARDIEWQWHQLGHMQVCTSLQTDNHTSTPPLSFLQAGCPSCRPTNSVKALKAAGTTAYQ